MSAAIPTTKPKVFLLYRDSPLRRAALETECGDGARYSLYGLDEFAAAGYRVSHSLEPGVRVGAAARASGAVLDRAVRAVGGYSGDFATVVASRRQLNGADVVFSTVDTVGIPLALLARRGLVRTPLVYAAIGLPERLAQLRTTRARRMFRDAYRRLHTIVAYGWGEVDALREWLGDGGPRVLFVPFGVDTTYFAPRAGTTADYDLVSVGADSRRDHELYLALARAHPEWSFRLVLTRDAARSLGAVPGNVTVEADIPFDGVRDRLARARAVVLPVRDNSYSGATTVLLQGMATGKPVVVSRTAAIATGYHLDDGVNCRLVSPGSLTELDAAVRELLADDSQAASLGARARETVERSLGWSRYVDTLGDLLSAAARSRVSA
ncbi:MAG: glycosyltransferase family 4 protein [Thermoleophilia bacterium]|nr:glycosyltransferase family 4 protein [Thermoleophilia bacterium]